MVWEGEGRAVGGGGGAAEREIERMKAIEREREVERGESAGERRKMVRMR